MSEKDIGKLWNNKFLPTSSQQKILNPTALFEDTYMYTYTHTYIHTYINTYPQSYH